MAQAAEREAEVARLEAERLAAEEAQKARTSPIPVAPQTQTGYPRFCTLAGTFDEGPCIPASLGCVLPDYICRRESSAINLWNTAGSGASGKYQFMPGTWNGYGGYAHAAWAPEATQDEKASLVWAGGAGCGHWAACG